MQCLVKLYDKCLVWAKHPKAEGYLAVMSFVEASVFPIPPYVMLAPMSLAKPDKAIRYALIATISSVLGGVLGYMLGMLLFTPVVLPVLEYFNYVDKYSNAVIQLQQQGFWAVLVAGFMPIPFKLVAIGSGFMRIPIISFLFASLFGRAIKFYIIALVVKLGGVTMENKIRTLVSKLGMILVLAIAGAVAFSLSGCVKDQPPAKVVQVSPSISRVAPKQNLAKKKTLVDKKIASKRQPSSNPIATSGNWVWPTQGSVLGSFSPSKKGIDIAGRDGAAVVAASGGEVVYSGNSLRGYGNLIIIRHDKNYLTAYAHNKRNLVHEGDKVRTGQRIAEMGRTGADKTMLHFEVRNQGKPVDPLRILPKR